MKIRSFKSLLVISTSLTSIYASSSYSSASKSTLDFDEDPSVRRSTITSQMYSTAVKASEIEEMKTQLALNEIMKHRMDDALNSHPSLRAFYDQLNGSFTDLILSYKVLHLGLVARKNTMADSFISALSSIGDEITVIPFAGVITKALGIVLDNQYEKYLHGRQVKMASYLTSLEILNEEAHKISFLLAYNYRLQIQQLDVINAKILANCALYRIHRFLLSRKLSSGEGSEAFHKQVADGIRKVYFPKNFSINELIRKAIGKNLDLETRNGVLKVVKESKKTKGKTRSETWHESFVFCYTGVCSEIDGTKRLYTIQKKADFAGSAKFQERDIAIFDAYKKYGFRFGVMEEADLESYQEYKELSGSLDDIGFSSVLNSLRGKSLIAEDYFPIIKSPKKQASSGEEKEKARKALEQVEERAQTEKNDEAGDQKDAELLSLI